LGKLIPEAPCLSKLAVWRVFDEACAKTGGNGFAFAPFRSAELRFG
jgi:hypothetical protein